MISLSYICNNTILLLDIVNRVHGKVEKMRTSAKQNFQQGRNYGLGRVRRRRRGLLGAQTHPT